MEDISQCTMLHSELLLQGLNDLRQRGYLCDVKLHVDGSCIPAHRAVLASCSPYFMAMFTGEMSEAQKSDIVIHSVDSSAMLSLINYAYTGSVDINQKNVQSLLPAANLLQLKAVTEQCCSFLKAQLHPSNSIGIARFAELHGCFDLNESASRYTLTHFTEVAQNDEFIHLTSKDVSLLISSSRLVVASEEMIYNAVEAWAVHDFEFRKHSLPNLLGCLRLLQIPLRILFSFLSNQLVMEINSKKFINHVNAVIDYKQSGGMRLSQDKLLAAKINISPRAQAKRIYAIGGKNDLFATLSRVDSYCPKKGWLQMKSLPKQTFECAAITCQGQLFVLGGIFTRDTSGDDVSGRCHDNSVLRLDPAEEEWGEVTSMRKGRSAMAVAVLRGCIYVLGGYDGQNYLSSVEKYDPACDEWSFVTSMSKSRSCFGAACIEDYLYAAGGYGPPCINRCVGNLQHLFTYMGERSVEKYSWEDDRWEVAAPMFEKRINFAMSSLHGFLYVVGGHNGVAYLSSMERYDPHTNQWTRVAGMGTPRTGLGTAIVDGKIYAVGGHSGSSYLNSVQCYDPFTDTWSREHSMSTCRCSFGLAAL